MTLTTGYTNNFYKGSPYSHLQKNKLTDSMGWKAIKPSAEYATLLWPHSTPSTLLSALSPKNTVIP